MKKVVLLSEYNQALKDVNNKIYDTVIFKCEYSKDYGFPEYILISYAGGSDYKENQDGSFKKRFKHLTDDDIPVITQGRDKKWEKILKEWVQKKQKELVFIAENAL